MIKLASWTLVSSAGENLRAKVHDDGPVHQSNCQIITLNRWEAQDWHHDQDERASHDPNGLGEFAQVPWSPAESVTNTESLDADRDCECDIRSDGTNGEDGTNCNGSTKYQEKQKTTNRSVEPDSIHRRVSVLVNTLDPERTWEAAITGISECDSRGCNHTSLSHGEATDDCEGEDGQGCVLWHNLNKVRRPWLSEIRADDRWNIDDRVGNDQLQCPSSKTSNTGCHDDGSW